MNATCWDFHAQLGTVRACGVRLRWDCWNPRRPRSERYREAASRGQRTLTLEPRLLYLYVPYRNQDNLPLFDTALPDLYPVELFRTNRYVGADRVGDADQVSVGLTSRLLDARDGRQFLAVTFGQTYYFQNPRVRLPDEMVRTDRRSDFVAQVALTAFRNWGADLGLQWDPQTSSSERAHVPEIAPGTAESDTAHCHARRPCTIASSWGQSSGVFPQP